MIKLKRKRCRICRRIKPLTEFYRVEHRKDGHRSECKLCFREMVKRAQAKTRQQRLIKQREWYRTHRDYFVKYRRRYRIEHRKELKAYHQKYYAEHKDYFRKKKEEYKRDQKKLAQRRAYNKEWSRRFRTTARLVKQKKEAKKAAR
ncbi:MAG: hypothetical protein M1132_09855 [Chloroflexi bacterium]|nr:hypothetical protein [Chloroflexota bacterium]